MTAATPAALLSSTITCAAYIYKQPNAYILCDCTAFCIHLNVVIMYATEVEMYNARPASL